MENPSINNYDLYPLLWKNEMNNDECSKHTNFFAIMLDEKLVKQSTLDKIAKVFDYISYFFM